ncbi:UbiD family decarboxylase (plasmid) [Sinorhizobium meliloti]|nr:UbiD family decarboxylase [Sinorhizobium meliloti]
MYRSDQVIRRFSEPPGLSPPMSERRGRLRRHSGRPVSLVHEVTEIHRRVLLAGGPALLFEKPVDASGRIWRHSAARQSVRHDRADRVGFRAARRGSSGPCGNAGGTAEPRSPQSLSDAWGKLPLLKTAFAMRPAKASRDPPAQETVWRGAEADLSRLPIQWCWPGEPAPLVTWPLVITRAPDDPSDVMSGSIACRCSTRTGICAGSRIAAALDTHRMWQQRGEAMPVRRIGPTGNDPRRVMPPAGRHERACLRRPAEGRSGQRSRRRSRCRCLFRPMPRSSSRGVVAADDTAEEVPMAINRILQLQSNVFRVMSLSAINAAAGHSTLSTFTGRPPDEPSKLGEAMMELFLPLVKRQFPEIVDLYLPPEALLLSCDGRLHRQALTPVRRSVS